MMDENEIYLPPVQLPPTTPASPIPMAAPPQPVSHEIVLDDNQLYQLKQQGYTDGLSEALCENCNTFPLRIFIVDNSGSMNFPDGNRLVATANSAQVKSVGCTRWREIQETIDYHAEMAALLRAPTIFRLLNDPIIVPKEFSIGVNSDSSIAEDLRIAKNTMQKATPTGVTPLLEHLRAVKTEVDGFSPTLRAEGKRIAIILATDGLPSDARGASGTNVLNDFTNALRDLEGLPIWLVIRLCTDDEKVVEFYNNLDSQLELSIEVIDNFLSEAKEMYTMNPWMNYSLPIHRMRELGFQHRIFDLLDERKLSISELREYCILLFGAGKLDGLPEPEVDFKGFLHAIDRILRTENDHWHPVKMKSKPLLSLSKLRKVYGDGKATCNIM